MKKNSKPSALINLGPKSTEMLAEVGITTIDQLRAVGAVEAYMRVHQKFGNRFNRLGLYALHAALQDRHWQEVTEDEKQLLNELVAQAKGSDQAS